MFQIIVLTVLTVIMLLSIFFARNIFSGRSLIVARLILVLFNVGGATYMVLYGRALADEPYGKFAIVLLLSLLVAQIVTLALTMLGVAIRRLWRAMLSEPVDYSRRQLLQGSILYPLAGLGASAYGTVYERNTLVRNDYIIPVKNLLPSAELTIAQISDVHIGIFVSNEDFRSLLQLVADSGADILAVTGDVFDDATMNEEAVAILADFVPKFPKGIYFCIGNHEYFRGAERTLRLLRQTPIKVLINEAVKVDNAELYIAGVDYPMSRGENFDRDREYCFQETMSKVKPDVPTILLAHHPDFIDNGFAHESVVLTLTGHTHGGQFGIWGMPLFPVFRYTRGMYEENNSYGYVHVGNGSWFPVRIGCPPEVAYFKLVRK